MTILLTSEGKTINGSAVFTSTKIANIARQVVEKPNPVIPLTNDAMKNAKVKSDKFVTVANSRGTNNLHNVI